MARALIVGCGCRGRELGAGLLGRGWRVRGTSRTESGLEAIEAARLEAALADPDRPGTILDLVADVSVVVWLLGSAQGEEELLGAIHGPRLERLLEKVVDSPVRGFAYEGAGTTHDRHLDAGRALVKRAARTWRIPVVILDRGRDERGWAESTTEAVAELLEA